jgi:hypothetical protein
VKFLADMGVSMTTVLALREAESRLFIFAKKASTACLTIGSSRRRRAKYGWS